MLAVDLGVDEVDGVLAPDALFGDAHADGVLHLEAGLFAFGLQAFEHGDDMLGDVGVAADGRVGRVVPSTSRRLIFLASSGSTPSFLSSTAERVAARRARAMDAGVAVSARRPLRPHRVLKESRPRT